MRSLSRAKARAPVAAGQAPSYLARADFARALMEALRTPVAGRSGADNAEEQPTLFAQGKRPLSALVA